MDSQTSKPSGEDVLTPASGIPTVRIFSTSVVSISNEGNDNGVRIPAYRHTGEERGPFGRLADGIDADVVSLVVENAVQTVVELGVEPQRHWCAEQ